MVTSSSLTVCRLIFCAVLLVPTMALADEPKEQSPSEPGTDPPTATEPAPISEEGDGGVRSRAPGKMLPSSQIPMSAIRDLQAFKQAAISGPLDVTVTPVTPTNLQVEWSPSPGAIRYLISRNGAPDLTIEASSGLLNRNNRFGYMDLGRKPATLHTYSVTAQFNPPLLPVRSAAVQLVTPPALPPQNFRAAVSSPNTVTLNWTGLPEAAGSYRIIRYSENLPATVLNALGINFVDRNLPPGQYRYMICSVIRLANGEELLGEFSNPVTLRVRPFNIVAIGDSYMWGQGLNEQNKFARKVANWLEQDVLGPPVNLNNMARSGAVTHSDPGQPALENTDLPDYKEVPWSFPSISFQARVMAPALVPPNDVDLVLVGGCGNNVDVSNIFNPVGNDEELRNNTREFCGRGMQNVLTDVAGTFSYAKVVVTGYLPFVSGQSNLAFLVPFVGIATPLYRARTTDRSDIFFQESTSSLQSAVNTMNSMPTPLGGDRFRYTSLPVGPDNAYAAPNTWVWLIPTPPVVKDEVYDLRGAACDRWKDKVLNVIKCKEASMGHPNVRGAQAYTDAIKSVLTPFLSEWRTVHARSVTAPDDSLVIRVQPGPSEPGGGALIVAASDGPSGPPLPGIIKINGVSAGTLGNQIRYGFREHNPTEILVGVEVPGRRPRSFTIPVRTLSVAVNVTNNGDPRTAIMTVTDGASGEMRNGVVAVNPFSSKQAVGTTGQPVTYPSCGVLRVRPTLMGIDASPRPAPCGGTVYVPFYPEAAFQDFPGTVEVLPFQLQRDNLSLRKR